MDCEHIGDGNCLLFLFMVWNALVLQNTGGDDDIDSILASLEAPTNEVKTQLRT